MRCPRCGIRRAWNLEAQRKYQCKGCNYQFSVTSQTVFHKLKIPIHVLVGFVLLCEGFEWKRGTRLWLSRLNPYEDVSNPISWPTTWRLWGLALRDEWDNGIRKEA